MRPDRERQDLQRLLQPSLVLQEVGVRHQAQAQAGERLGADGDGVGDAVKVGALGRVGGQLPKMAPDGVELPEEPFTRSLVRVACEQPVDQTRHQVGPKGQSGGHLTLAFMLRARAFQKGRVGQNVC